MEVMINKKDLVNLLTLGKKALEIEEITGYINSGYLEVNELSRSHDLLVNAKYPVYSDTTEKYIKFNCNELNEVKKIKDRSIRIQFNEHKGKDKLTVRTDYSALNMFRMSVEELCDLIEISDVLACLNLKISKAGIEFEACKIKVNREVNLNTMKQEDAVVYLDCGVLSRLREVLEDFIEEVVEIYYGKDEPVLFKIVGKRVFEAYIPPITEKEYL